MSLGMVSAKTSSSAFMACPELKPGRRIALIWADRYSLNRTVNSGP